MIQSLLTLVVLFSAVPAFVFGAAPGSFFADGNRSKKAIALTFDDGPGENSKTVLEILDKENIKATFFMNGDQVELRPQIAKEIVRRGHEIGDHTYSHVNFYAYEKKFGTEKTKIKMRDETRLSKAAIEKATGVSPAICRMPNGYAKSWTREIAKDFGYALVNWTFGQDWLNVPEDKMIENYIAHLKPGSILLFHDGGRNRQKTIKALPRIIQEARKRNLAFLKVTEIIGD